MLEDWWRDELIDEDDPMYALLGYFEEGMDNWIFDQNDEGGGEVLNDIKNYLADNANWEEIAEYMLKSNKV
jgi:hypothetical protein